MADYKIRIGTELDTGGIDKEVKGYSGNVEVDSTLDTSGITKMLNAYKPKPLNVNTKLSTTGITKALKAYKAKDISVKIDPNFTGIEGKIEGHIVKTPLKVGVDLTWSGVAQKIKDHKETEAITVDAILNDEAITKAINEYETSKPIRIKIDPDFSEVNFEKVEELLGGYTARTPLKVNVDLQKGKINEQIADYNKTAQSDGGRTIILKAKLTDNAVAEAISNYKVSNAERLKIPVDLTFKSDTEFDTTLKQKIQTYENTPVQIPVKLKPASKGFTSQIEKLPIYVDAILKNADDINKAVNAYSQNPVSVAAKLVPAKNFDSSITKKPVKIQATLDPDNINSVIESFQPTSRMKVDVMLVPKDINGEIKKLSKPTEPLDVDVDLNEASVNSAITGFKPTARLNVGVDLNTEDINAQIDGIVPTSKVKVNLDLDESDISSELGKQNPQTPITVNVKLDRKNLNEKIREFKTATKLNVGVKLDFASHKGGQKGVPQQIKDYKTSTKIKVGVQLDKESIGQAINGLTIDEAVPISIRLEPNSVRTVQNQINDIREELRSLEDISIRLSRLNQNNGRQRNNNTNWAYKQMLDVQKKANALSLKINKLDTSKNVNELRELSLQFARLRSDYEVLMQTFGRQLSPTQLGNLQAEIDETSAKLSAMDAKLNDVTANKAKGIRNSLSGYDSKVQVVIEKFNKLSDESVEVQNAIDRVKQALIDMKSASNDNALIEAEQRLQDELKETNAILTTRQSLERQDNYAESFETKKEAAIQRLNGLFEEGSQAAKVFGSRVEKLRNELNQVGNIKGIDIIDGKIKNLSTEIKNSNLQVKTLGSRLKEQFSKYSQYLSVASVFMYTVQGLRSMFEQVKLIDSAMTELKKVTDETDESYNKFLTNAASRAKEIGTTIDGLVASTADFARLGYGFKDAQGLAEVANIYAVVGDEVEGVEGATESLISTMAAFKDEMNGMSNSDFAMSIIDKFNEIGNNFAISSGGIGEAMERSASSMMAANNTLDETIALITAANTVVQNPDAVGTAFKTISMRIRGAKTELEEAGLETDGMVESTAKLRQEIMALSGVDIMEANGQTFKSTYAILDELAVKWQDLSDIQQATITELVAGKRQGNIVSSLMTNFQTARDALETSLNSSGSAMKEHEKWQQSLEAQINKLKAAWQGLSQSFLSSDFLKVAFDFIIKLVDGITLLIDKVGVLPTLFTGFAIFKSFGNKGLFKTFGNEFESFAKSVGVANHSFAELMKSFKSANTGGFKGFISGLKSMTATLKEPLSDFDKSAIAEYNKLVDQGAVSQENLARVMKGTSDSAQSLVKSANGGKIALNAMNTASVGVKAGLIGAKVAAIAFNTALTMGISLLIDWAISAIMKVINAKKELAEKVEEVTSKFREQHSELTKNRSSFESEAQRYAKLSKGVDNLGRNVSLTADEYSEYQSIVNSIADQIPSLISGYDEQGNAILSCKGSVEELRKEYEKLIHAQNQEILINAGKIEDNFKNATKDKKSSFWDTNELNFEAIKDLEDIYNGANSPSEISDLLYSFDTWSNTWNGNERKQIAKALNDASITDLSWWDINFNSDKVDKAIAEAAKANPETIGGIIDGFYAEFDEEVEQKKNIAQAKLSEAFDVSSIISGLNYGNISEDLQTVAYQLVNGLDYNFFADLQEQGKTVEQWITEVLNQLNSIDKTDSNQISAAFDLQTKFNSGEISYGEYVNGLENVNRLIDELGLDKEVASQIRLSLGLSEKDDKWVVEEYEALLERLTSEEYGIKMKPKAAEDFLKELNANELSVAVDLIASGDVDLSNFDASSLRKYIEEKAKLLEAMNYTIAIDVEAESLDALNTAMAESVSGAGLSSEAIAALKGRYAELESEGYNLSAMFEETANGIHLNRKVVGELEQKLASNKLVETDKQLKVLKNRYDDLTTEIDKCRDAGDRAALYTEQQSIVEKINDLATLASQYEGLTSAYNAWQNAESAGSERDMYESVIEGFETVGDEISRGWVDDGTIKFLELLTGKTGLAGKSGKDLKKIYDDLDDTIKNTTYSVRDFFTVDEDGNSTNTGVYNFLDAIGQLEEEKFGGKDVVKRDKDGNVIGFDFEIVAKKDKNGNVIKNGDQVIAEALGISEELVQIMVRAADDAGFVINLEGTYTQLADLKTEAESARDTLISLKNKGLKKLKGVDVNFDFNAEGNDLVKEQGKAVKLLDKFKKDGKIDLKMEGAQQALDIAEYLTIKLDDLTEPRYMQIDTAQVEEDIREPLEDMQEFERLSKEKHLLQLTGDEKKIKEVQDDMDEIANGLEDLDKETKVKLGIDGLTSEEIADKLEKGEIEIPAELNLDVQMSDDLKDMRLMMMNQLGLVSDDEVKLKVGFDIDESTVDELTPDKQKVVVEYIVENEDEFNKYTDKEKEAVIKLVADGVDLEKYEVEDKEAIVNYIANGEEADGWTPEAKDAFVKYLADGGEIDKFDPKNKDSWVVYDIDTTKPDDYNADKTGTVIFEKDSSAIDNWKPVVTGLAKFVLSMIVPQSVKDALAKVGISIVNGTANLNGTAFLDGTTGRAFKQGSWGTKNSGVALMGELGRETIVRDGKFFTVGDSGAGFYQYKKGDIIFNHKQTEELFANGKVTSGGGRAKAFASGTAFAHGSVGTGAGLGKIVVNSGSTKETTEKTVNETVKKFANKVKNIIEDKVTRDTSSEGTTRDTGSEGTGGDIKVGGDSVGGDTSSSEKFEETIDWIEVAISRVERAIDSLDKTANNVYKSWSDRNKALVNEIGKVEDEIALQESAYNRYMQEANSVGLSSSWASKVRNGEIDIDTITDESLKEKIDDYQNWYEKALACQDAIEELKETELSLYEQRFENVSEEYDGIIQGFEHTEAMLNEYISQAEAKGHIVSKNYYQALIDNEEANIDELKEKQADLIAARDEAEANGIDKSSQAWRDMCADIDSVTQAIEEGSTSLIEYANSMRDIDWEVFDLIQERISNITEEADFLIELMSNKDLFDDKGNLTGQGLATMALHGQNYNTYMYQADDYGTEAAKLDKQIAKDPYNQELVNRRNEYLELQRESILAAEDEKNAIADLVEEGIELELDALQELIDKKNEELESERDLYEYQKKVREQTEEIASLEKRMAAYSGDDSEEAKQKVQQIKVDLETARQDLKETEYDKLIDDTSSMLDALYTEYELILNTRLDNIDYLLQQVVDGINAAAGAEGTITMALGENGAIAMALSNNTAAIGETLKTEVGAVGTKLSTAMSNIWLGDGSGKAIIDLYGKDFQSKSTTTNEALKNIKADVAAMVDDVDKDAKKKVDQPSTQPSSKVDPAKGSNNGKNDKGGNKGAEATDDQLMGIAASIWVYGSGSGWGNDPVRSGKIAEKFDAATAKKVQSLINKHGLNGDLYNFWIKNKKNLDKYKYSAFKSGAKDIDLTQLAWTQEMGQEFIVRPSDGAILTPVAKGDSVLNATASSNIWNMANSPAEFIKDNLNLGATNVPNNSNVQSNCTQHFENIVFSMPNVKNYGELLSEMQRDPKFEKLILSMTIDQIAGKSSLAKGKSIR